MLALDVCDRASDRDGTVVCVLELALELLLVVIETVLSTDELTADIPDEWPGR